MAALPEALSNGIDVSIASSPNNPQIVEDLVSKIATGVSNLNKSEGLSADEARHELLLKARGLVQALETPRETMIKHVWAQAAVISAVSLGVDTGLWALMVENGDSPQKVTDLAAKLNINPVLLGRLMKHLGAMGYILETGPDEYKPTNYSKALSLPIIGDGYIAMMGGLSAAPMEFHEFARKRGWINPTDSRDTALAYAYNTDKDAFSWLHSLGYGKRFNHHMGGYRLGRVPWMAPGFYPVQEHLVTNAETDPESPFLVDIGGNVGHDLAEFHKYFPNAPGKLIVQDLPEVIDQIEQLDPAIERMKYDFFTAQPVKGARAYYMHSCLHDWPDEKGKLILEQIKGAMKPGYSKLLVNENVIPNQDAYWETTALDIVMLTNFSAKERTESDWHALIESAGLRVVKIWNGAKGVESLIECELA